MTNSNETDSRCARTVKVLMGAWVFISAALWTTFAQMPTGVIAIGDAGKVVSVAQATVITTRGVFVIDAKSVSVPTGATIQIEQINNAFASSDLRLCTMPREVGGVDQRCVDLKGEYFGPMAPTSLARRAWSGDAMDAWLVLAMLVTAIGWMPGAFLSLGCDCDADTESDGAEADE